MPQPIPFLPGPRVGLHVLEPEDAPQILAWFSDPEVRQYVKMTNPMTLAAEREWLEKKSQTPTDTVFGLVTANEKKFIGTMGIHKINRQNGTASTGTVIGEKDHWGKGFGFEAKMVLLDHAFNGLRLRKVNSMVYATNPRSRRCLEKCGYKEEGCRRAEIWKNGAYLDVALMAVFREDWLPLWEKFREGSK